MDLPCGLWIHEEQPWSFTKIHKFDPQTSTTGSTRIHHLDPPGGFTRILNGDHPLGSTVIYCLEPPESIRIHNLDPTESSSIHPLDPPGFPKHNRGNPALGFRRLHHWDPQGFKQGCTRIHNLDPPGSSMWFNQDPLGSTTGIHKDPPPGSTT